MFLGLSLINAKWFTILTHQGIAVLVKSHAGGWFEELPVQSGQNPHVVVGAGGGADNASVLVHGLQELADNERNRLDTFDLLLCVDVLLPEVPHLVLDVLLLHLQELQLLLELLVFNIEII